MAKPTVEEAQKELEFREKQEASGALTAIIASLSNDDEARANWLKKQRFPQNPDVVYFTDEEGDMAYVDPNTDEIKKEFYDYTDWVDSYDIYGKIVPGIQLGAEIVGGLVGLGVGYRNAPFPTSKVAGRTGAAVTAGGFTGLAGGIAYDVRELASNIVDGPEMNFEKLREDLYYSSLAGSVPIGINKHATLIRKFDHPGGSDDLAMVLQLAQDTDAKTAVQYYKEKTGVDILVSEIDYAAKDPIRIQRYLQNQTSGTKLRDFYATRNTQIEESIDTYLDVLQSGKYITGRASEKITGAGDSNPAITVKNLSEDVIVEIAAKRKVRYLRLLEDAKNEADTYYTRESGEVVTAIEQRDFKEVLDVIPQNERSAYMRKNGLKEISEPIRIDTSPIITKIDDMIANPDSSAVRKKTLGDIRKLFFNADGSPKNTVSSLHQLKVEDLGSIVSEAGPSGSSAKNAIAANLKEDLNLLIKEYSPLYEKATSFYNPEKAHTQILQKGVVGVLGKLVGDDAKLAKTVQRMFRGQASEREVRAFRRLVQTKDPQAFQNLKHMFLSDELATAGGFLQFSKKVGFGNLNPKYIEAQRARDIAVDGYSAALNEFGTNSRQATLAGSKLKVAKDSFEKAGKYLDQRKKIYKSLLSDQEFDAFVLLNDTIQRGSFIAKQSDSMTQPFARQREAIKESAVGPAGKTTDFALQILNLFNLRGARDAYKNKIADDLESSMIDLLLTPENLDEVVGGLEVVRPYIYATLQGAYRTPGALAEESSLGDISEETQEGRVEEARKRLEEMENQSNDNLSSQLDSALQGVSQSNMPLVPPANAITPEQKLSQTTLPQNMISEILLPNEDDRLIAQRQAQGIGSLV